ncbi:MAG: polyprenyl synthetase family protein [Chloroflexota bacterium]|nr:MAG: polyprenyl synthetase [Chloroflexota bacterium]
MWESSLRELQSRYGPTIDAELRRSLGRDSDLTFFRGMMGYQLGYLDQRLNPVTAPSGKRFRSSLCLLACEGAGGDTRDALHAAVAIELLHNFSLIHDDIEDGDVVRRHRPTVWRVWGEPHAINVGDGMFALAHRTILRATGPGDTAREVSTAFMDMALALTEGQYMDMSFETRSNVSSAEYLEMISRKTAALIRFSAWAGASLGGASSTARDGFSEYGVHLGTAFQIHDDVMGVWGVEAVTGKQAAQDLHKRKKTLPLLIAIERGSASQRRDLDAFLSRSVDDIRPVLDILSSTGAEKIARETISDHVARALHALDCASVKDPERSLLESLTRDLTSQRLETNADTVTKA